MPFALPFAQVLLILETSTMQRTKAIQVIRPLVTKVTYKRSIVVGVPGLRTFATQSEPKSAGESSSSEPPSRRPLNIALVLGGLALGSYFASKYFGDHRKPRQSIDSAIAPVTKVSRSFAPGEVSVIFVLGGPGAGKGTQSENLVRDYQFVHLSAGDLLREEQKRPNSQYGQLIADYIKAGLIVPQEVTLGLLDRAMKEEVAKGHKRFLVDGFPRKMDQAISFEERVGDGLSL